MRMHLVPVFKEAPHQYANDALEAAFDGLEKASRYSGGLASCQFVACW